MWSSHRPTPHRCQTILPSTRLLNPGRSTQKSICRRRSGTYQSSPSLAPSTGSPHTVGRHHLTSRKTKTAAEYWNGRATALPLSSASQFMRIPVRSHRSSVVSPHPGPTSRSATSITTKFDTPLLFIEVPLPGHQR